MQNIRNEKGIEARFSSKVNKTVGFGPEGECWKWEGGINSNGYGAMQVADRMIGAHRIAYDIANGPIPTGGLVRHSCDTPLCVNPAHLLLGDAKQNSDDKIARGRHNNQKKTHCKRGHELLGDNLIQGAKQRTCKTCFYESRKKSDKKRYLARTVTQND